MFDKLRYSSDLVGKKIVAMNLHSTFCYIITEGGEAYCFEISENEVETLSPSLIERRLHDDTLREKFLKHGVISQEFSDSIAKEKSNRLKKQSSAREQEEYKTYLKLKRKFEGV